MKPYYQDDYATIYHCDCREVLPGLGKVDLVLTDPPYGIGEAGGQKFRWRKGDGRCKDPKPKYADCKWDATPVNWGLLWELLTLGKHACCFGGNYYPVPPSPSWLFWDKQIGGDFADGELAWTNYGGALRKFTVHPFKNLQGGKLRQHPTQKPLSLMVWCITLCPDDPQTILDPFMGSGTTLRAAKDLRRKAIGIELEETYCEIAAKRLAQEVLNL